MSALKELQDARERIIKLEIENTEIKQENERVTKEFKEFKEALKDRLAEIKKMRFFKRISASIRLVFDLFKELEDEIDDAIDKNKN